MRIHKQILTYSTAVEIPSLATQRLCRAARANKTTIVIGVNERNVEASGGSAIINLDGEFVAGSLLEQEGILYAEITPAQMGGPTWMLDVAGHYARPDVFQLKVNREKQPVIANEQEDEYL